VKYVLAKLVEILTLPEPLVGQEGVYSSPIFYPIDAFSISDISPQLLA